MDSDERRYGCWAGRPNGSPKDKTRCVEEVPDGPYLFKQCSRKRGHGPRAEYCRQHAKRYGEADDGH